MDIDALIETWTQAERSMIHAALATRNIGRNFKLTDDADTWVMPLNGEVQPQLLGASPQTAVITSRTYVSMHPSKLIILEPSFEQVEEERIIDETLPKIEKTWWGKERVVSPRTVSSRIIEHRKIITAPRSIWRIHAMWIGAHAQFPLEKTMSGDLFSPDGTLQLSGGILAGLDVSITVENTTTQKMPFSAVIVGKQAKSKE